MAARGGAEVPGVLRDRHRVEPASFRQGLWCGRLTDGSGRCVSSNCIGQRLSTSRLSVSCAIPSRTKYAWTMPTPSAAKRGAVPWLRNRIAQATERAAEKMDSDPESALRSAQATLDWSIRHRGADSTMTLKAKVEVAERLERLGRYEEAVQLRRELLTHFRLLVGPGDPSTLTAEGFQALDLVRLRRPQEALPLYQHVLAGRADALGPEHEQTLLAMEWLGCTLRSLGNLPQSRHLLQQAVDRYEQKGAGESEECMKATSHLATTLLEMGQVPESCELRRHILDVRSRTLGPDDPTTLSSLETLANTLRRLELED